MRFRTPLLRVLISFIVVLRARAMGDSCSTSCLRNQSVLRSRNLRPGPASRLSAFPSIHAMILPSWCRHLALWDARFCPFMNMPQKCPERVATDRSSLTCMTGRIDYRVWILRPVNSALNVGSVRRPQPERGNSAESENGFEYLICTPQYRGNFQPAHSAAFSRPV